MWFALPERTLLLLVSVSTILISATNLVLEPRGVPSFWVDYEKGTLMLDGQPFRYLSGSLHYFRIHPSQWLDRLQRVRALGLNAVQFYIPWNFHEMEQGSFDFDGWRDFTKFIKLAAEQGLFSIVRLGPYACAEWENGGLPYWLLINNTDIKQRSHDSRFISAVSVWYKTISEKLRPLLRNNAGPVLMVQIENEYGTYDACDHEYTYFLRDEAWKYLGQDTLIYTTDMPSAGILKCGSVNGTLTTVDFGPRAPDDIKNAYDLQVQFQPKNKGPRINSEFYTGWMVQWGQELQDLPPDELIMKNVEIMWNLSGSINFYMIHGGTNYGFWNGAEWNGGLITSYDYSAPITESGNFTTLYFALWNWIRDIPGWNNVPLPPPNPIQSNCTSSDVPLSFEQLHQQFGYVLYSTTVKKCGSFLSIWNIHDLGYVYLDGKRQGTLIQQLYDESIYIIILQNCVNGSRLDILVENQGRRTFETINDYKGISEPILIDNEKLESGPWVHCRLEMPYEYTYKSPKDKQQKTDSLWGMLVGSFEVDAPSDTYLDMKGWGKGHVQVNGHNVGRYWSTVGPQYNLYVPAAFLKPGNNDMAVFQVIDAINDVCSPTTKECILKFANQPDIHFKK